MNVVDSSGWLEYFSNGPNAKHFIKPLEDTDALVVPVISIYEVFKVILRERSENEALQAAAAMQKATICDLTTTIALSASKISLQHNLPMADSIILASAQLYDATLWTQDADFKGISKVKYFAK
jgi:predicted nucleic acid-binding protein